MGRQRFVAKWFQRFLTHAPDGRRGEAQRGFDVRVGAALLAVRIQGRAAQLIEHGQSSSVVALLLHAAACYPRSGWRLDQFATEALSAWRPELKQGSLQSSVSP